MAETLCGKKVHCTAFDPFHLLGRYLREERALMQYGTEYSSIYEADRHGKAKRSEARPGERGEGQYLLRQSTCCSCDYTPLLLTAVSIRSICLSSFVSFSRHRQPNSWQIGARENGRFSSGGVHSIMRGARAHKQLRRWTVPPSSAQMWMVARLGGPKYPICYRG